MRKKTKTYSVRYEMVYLPISDTHRFGLEAILNQIHLHHRQLRMSSVTICVPETLFSNFVAPHIQSLGYQVRYRVLMEKKSGNPIEMGIYNPEFLRNPLQHGDIVEYSFPPKYGVIALRKGKLCIVRGKNKFFYTRFPSKFISAKIEPSTLDPQLVADLYSWLQPPKGNLRTWRITCTEDDPKVAKFMKNKHAIREEISGNFICYTVKLSTQSLLTFRTRAIGRLHSGKRSKIGYCGDYSFAEITSSTLK
jgi:hypothetical protein